MSLNSEQQQIFDSVTGLVKGAILIKGFAGTGKTFLAKEMIDEFINQNKSVTCLAPTHQAKLQLQSNIKERAKLKFTTVASFLNVKLQKNKMTGRKEFTDGSINKSKVTDIIIVDESSMLTDKQVYNLLRLQTKALVIFIGDFNQLPPVKSENGEIYFNTLITYELLNQQRNSGEILSLCNTLRQKVVYPTDTIENLVVLDSADELFDNLMMVIEYDPDPYKTSYLGFTNMSVNNYRNKIHNKIYGDDNFHCGQFVRLETPTETGTIGEIYVITNIKKETVNLFGEIDFDGYHAVIANIITGLEENIICLNYNDQDDVEECLEGLYREAEDAFFKFQKQKDPNKKKLAKMDWEDIIKTIETTEKIVMVSSPYALTVHKSQGRTIDHVFLDVPDIRKYGGDIKKKLLYVGASRAKECLITIK